MFYTFRVGWGWGGVGWGGVEWNEKEIVLEMMKGAVLKRVL